MANKFILFDLHFFLKSVFDLPASSIEEEAKGCLLKQDLCLLKQDLHFFLATFA